MAAVPTRPKIKPPFLNAFGMARIPEPRLLFIKCTNAPVALGNNSKNGYTPIEKVIVYCSYYTHVVVLDLSLILKGLYR
jgi:hypothetical protein